MFWKYLSLTLLLLSPSSRILTESAYESQDDALGAERRVIARETQDELIDKIVSQLSPAEPASLTDQENKRDSSVGTGNEQQQQQQQQQETQATGSSGSSSNHEEGAKVKAKDAVYHHAAPGVAERLQQPSSDHSEAKDTKVIPKEDRNFLITIFVILCVGFVGLMMAGVCYYKFKRSAKAASDVEYPAYGVTGPMKERVPSPGDRKLAQSAQMYHYQHQKQQMIAMEKANGDMKHDASDDDSEEDNVEGDYTVYECPGLAPTGEMEVKNPLFRGEDTPQAPGPPDLPPSQQTPPRE